MHNLEWLNLQLLADGGEGGDGAATGENAADAGQGTSDVEGRLRALGVPEDRIAKRAEAFKRRSAPIKQATDEAEQKQPAAQAEQKTEGTPATDRMTWEQIMQDPEYNARMQDTIKGRLKTAKGAEERLSKLAPVLESLGARYGIDASDISKMDIDALVSKVNSDDSTWERLADEKGVSVETAKQLNQMELFNQRQAAKQQQEQRNAELQAHFNGLIQQAGDLGRKYGIDVGNAGDWLNNELQNPTFVRYTAPANQGGAGLSVEDAYFAIHHDELANRQSAAIASASRTQIANAVKANRSRPTEAGASQAASLSSVDYRNMSQQQRQELRQRIRTAAARGEKLYPSDVFGRK